MANSEGTNQKKIPLDDSVLLKIREEVESAVEKRAGQHERLLEQRERYYTIIISIVGAFFSVIGIIMAAFFGYRALEMPRLIENKFADTEVSNAINTIFTIETNALTSQQTLNRIVASVKEDQQVFTNRLNAIKEQDNVVLVGDLQEMFVSQTVTNLVDGNKIVLKYEPVFSTVEFVYHSGGRSPAKIWGDWDSNTLVLSTNGLRRLISPAATNGLKVEYIRKSVR